MPAAENFITERDRRLTDRQLLLQMLGTQRMLTAEVARVVVEVEALREVSIETLSDLIDVHAGQAAVVTGLVSGFDARLAARREQLSGTTWGDAPDELPPGSSTPATRQSPRGAQTHRARCHSRRPPRRSRPC